MRLTTTLAATGGAALIGALTLGAALPATAAPATREAKSSTTADQGNRLQGPFVQQNRQEDDYYAHLAYAAVAVPREGVSPRQSMTRSKSAAASSAGVYTFPAIGTTGPVTGTGSLADLCLTATSTGLWGMHVMRACDESPSQQYTIQPASNGYFDGHALWSNFASYWVGNVDGGGSVEVPYGLLNTRLNVADSVETDLLTPIKSIADPTVKVISTNPADKSGVVGGTGEPGATLEVLDPTGKKHTTAVDKDGNWQISVPGLNFGDNAIPVRQIVEGEADKTTSVTIPLAPVDLSAAVKSTNKDDKTAVVGGKGQPGADITVTAPDGTKQTVKVDEDGNWTATVENLKTGSNPIKVEQTVEGAAPQTKDLDAPIGAADLSAEVISTDADKGTAVVGGKGEPGAELIVTGPEGAQTVVVDENGNWSITVPGMKEGDNPVTVEQKVGDDTQTKDLVVTLLPSPIANPAIAGGAAIAAFAALGTVLLRRRKLQQQ